MLKLRQTATLSTRRAKKGLGLGDLTEEWTARATPYLDDEPMAWVHELGGRDVPAFTSDEFEDEILLDVANAALDVVSTKRPTFSRANVQAEVFRQMQGVRFSRARRAAFSRPLARPTWPSPRRCSSPRPTCTTRHASCCAATAPLSSREPATGSTPRRRCSTPKPVCSTRASASTRPWCRSATVAAVAERRLPGRTFKLSIDQARCVEQITTSGRALDLLVGPAGTGKSTAMAGLRAAWEAEHGAGSVIGLAPSAAAAEVLGDDMGIDTDNLAKWLYEHRQHGQRARELSRTCARRSAWSRSPDVVPAPDCARVFAGARRHWLAGPFAPVNW